MKRSIKSCIKNRVAILLIFTTAITAFCQGNVIAQATDEFVQEPVSYVAFQLEIIIQ